MIGTVNHHSENKQNQHADQSHAVAANLTESQSAEILSFAPPALLSMESMPPVLQKKENDTGLPDELKSGLESLSGFSMDAVKVHYHSDKPAQFKAEAMAQGSEIHLGPGQERHLPHESWHVVQQMQGRVQAQSQLNGEGLNSDPALEQEADKMGAVAAQFKLSNNNFESSSLTQVSAPFKLPVQRKVGFEFETALSIKTTPGDGDIPYGVDVFKSSDDSWVVKSDNSKIEFVTKEVDTNDAGRDKMRTSIQNIVQYAGKLPALSAQVGTANKRLGRIGSGLGDTYRYDNHSVYLSTNNVSRNSIAAAPQASGGVTLDKIQQLFDQVLSQRLSHLEQSRTYKNPNAAPPPLVPTGDSDQDEINAINHEGLQWQYDEFVVPQLQHLQQQGVNPQKANLSLAGESLLMMNYMAAANGLVRAWEQLVLAFDDEEQEGFTQDSGIQHQNFMQETEGFRGLVTLIISYLLAGNGASATMPYSKSIAPVMSRTNFYQLYRLLSEKEKGIFLPDVVLGIAKMADGPVYKNGFYYYEGVNRLQAAGPNRAEWIRSIIEGVPPPQEQVAQQAMPQQMEQGIENLADNPDPQPQQQPVQPPVPADLMSVGSGSLVGRSSSSMGAFNKPDYNVHTEKNDLAVVELRSLPKNQGIDDWLTTAIVVFNMFEELNKTPDEKRRDEAQARRLKEDASKANGTWYLNH